VTGDTQVLAAALVRADEAQCLAAPRAPRQVSSVASCAAASPPAPSPSSRATMSCHRWPIEITRW